MVVPEALRSWRATYRVQLHAGFTLDDASAITGYLADLGISHLYCSPLLQAVPGSSHGYDVVDHSRVSEELGGRPAHDRLIAALGSLGMGQLLDVVPNHMAVGTDGADNPWWWDVLAEGASSPFARYFDIDWDPPQAKLAGRVLVPVLGDHYGRVLESGQITLEPEGAAFVVRYFGHRFPVAAETVDDARAVGGDLERLDALLQRQHYRLAHWRSGAQELNYRRFFDIDTLAALRMEEEQVFADTHRLVLDMVATGAVAGLRVDHPDGLRDPETYLRRLSRAAGDAVILVEKILEGDECLPESWPVAGTTGYEFLNRAGGLFVDPAGEGPLTSLYADFTGDPTDFGDVAHEGKVLVMAAELAADVEHLTGLLAEVCERHRRHRDHTRGALREAVVETIASFDVYRTYVRAGVPAGPDDVARVTAAVTRASRARPDLDAELFGFLAEVLLLRGPDGEAESELALRLPQAGAAVMAKGVEDTAFYRFNRLVSLNEVGGDPGRFGVATDEFHRAAAETARRWPGTLVTTSTHDTKRSEDVRARLHLLSEIPGQWAEAVWRWSKWIEHHRRGGLPDRNAEYLLYQTLVGAWPLDGPRAVAYMQKAAREAKALTGWTDPAPEYDDALAAFVGSVLDDAGFAADLAAFVAPLVWPGRVNSLAQTLLKLTSPGVADIYQGTEVWDLSLVDPDNRRPVDYAARRTLLDAARHQSPEMALAEADSGAPKMKLIHAALTLRRRLPEAMGGAAAYAPLSAAGERAAHVVALLRGGRVAAVVPRLVLGLERAGGWGDTTLALPAGRWVDQVTGDEVAGDEPLSLDRLLGRFPVALLAAT